MAETTIEWADYTFNPWRGCSKVSDGCANCYAEANSKRNPKVLGEWGDRGKRAMAAEAYWQLPAKWNKAAELAGVRKRVFCASLADVFEDRDELEEPRLRLFKLMAQTPALIWMLLTKRPQNIRRLVDDAADRMDHYEAEAMGKSWVERVWLGASVEDNETAAKRTESLLLHTSAAVRFLSAEPLLGDVGKLQLMRCDRCGHCGPDGLVCSGCGRQAPVSSRINWVIVGGESGPRARLMRPDWARSIRDQCQAAGVAFFFKQWGEWLPPGQDGANVGHVQILNASNESDRVGKKRAGRLLDGREWNEFPRSGE